MKKINIDYKSTILAILLVIIIILLIVILVSLNGKKDNSNKYEPMQKENNENNNIDNNENNNIEPQEEIKNIPDVSGLNLNDAIIKLEEEGFIVSDKQQISSDKIAKGQVVRTNPPANSQRKKGTEVVIYVSSGDTKIAIEDYTGKSYLEIKGKLETLKLNVIIEKKDVEIGTEDKYDAGKIIAQSIKAGLKLSEGESIILYIPNVINKYPNFMDGTWTVADVQNFANKNNLKLNIDYIATNEHESGSIYYQSKPLGYQIIAGQTFSIKVAK